MKLNTSTCKATNTGEGKSTSSYAYTATASEISYYYSGKRSWSDCGEFRMSVNSQTSYSRARNGTDKSNKTDFCVRRHQIDEDLLGWEGDRDSWGRIWESAVKSQVTESVPGEWFIRYWQDMGNRVHPLKASAGELNTSKKEAVLVATLQNSYTLCQGKL